MPSLATSVNSHVGPSTTRSNRLARLLWWFAHGVLVRPTPRPMHAWRAAVYRLFGARLGPNCHIYPSARVWAPWNLVCEDTVGIGEGAEIYNPALIRIGSHTVVSQGAYLCGATHDFERPGFPMVSRPITVGRQAWICARAVVGPGVTVGDGAVLGLASVTSRDLQAWTVHAGAPARPLRRRIPVPLPGSGAPD